MNEQYEWKKLRVVTGALTVAQQAIENLVIKGEEETIFDYRHDNPALYDLYMQINDCALKAHELMDD